MKTGWIPLDGGSGIWAERAIVVGADDHPEINTIAARLTDGIPDARQVVIAEADHYLPLRAAFAGHLGEHSRARRVDEAGHITGRLGHTGDRPHRVRDGVGGGGEGAAREDERDDRNDLLHALGTTRPNERTRPFTRPVRTPCRPGTMPAPQLGRPQRVVPPTLFPVTEMPQDHRPAKSVRVLLAEDQGMMRGALALLLGMERDIEVVAQVGRGDEIVDAALLSRPDVALLDIELPGRSGLDAAADLRDEVPDCRVLILTTFGRPGYLRRAMEAGAVGFLVKDGPVEELAEAVRKALRGETVIDPALAAAALGAGPNPLTAREREALAASVDGATIADIAARLHLSESTVRNYLSSAIGKTSTRNRMEAVRAARRQGWL